MPIPAYLWLKDDGGAKIRGNVDVDNREGSINVIAFSYSVNLPVDAATARIRGSARMLQSLSKRRSIHQALIFIKPYQRDRRLRARNLESAE